MTLPAERLVTRLCFHLWMRVPLDWHGHRWTMWLLERAGQHAYGEAE